MAEVHMPQLGESVTEGTITKWFKNVGERVELDEPLFEVSTDKVDSEVPSPIAGVVQEIRVPEGETVGVGTLLVVLGDGAPSDAAPSDAAPSDEAPPAEAAGPAAEAVAAPVAEAAPAPGPAPVSAVDPASVAIPAPQIPAPPAPAAPAVDVAESGAVLSPLVRRLITDNGLDPAQIPGTGVGGRITRDDVLTVIDARAGGGAAPATTPALATAAATEAAPVVAPPAAAPAPPAAPAPAAQAAAPAPVIVAARGDNDTVVPLSNIRRRTGEHMLASLATSPHAITAIDVDYEAVERARKPMRNDFKAEEGFSLTYLPFVARAVCDALGEYPHMNATVGNGELIVRGAINLSIAVDLQFEGLLAPVVRDADGKRLRAIAREINDLANRARTKKLSPDDLADGTFTLSNSGSYGTLLVAPIINQPQVAIMSTDGVKRRPVVVELPDGSESIAIHSVGNLTLSWDHRAFDGAYAASFMQRVKEILETKNWSAEF